MVKITHVSTDDIPPLAVLPIGEAPMEQRFTMVASKIKKYKLTFRLEGHLDPGIYIFQILERDGEAVVSDAFEAPGGMINAPATMVMPAFAEFTAKIVRVADLPVGTEQQAAGAQEPASPDAPSAATSEADPLDPQAPSSN